MVYSLFNIAQSLRVPEQYYILFAVLVVILGIVIALLKGLALWRSARAGQVVWFWVFVFIQTVGLLEIIYLLTNKERGTQGKSSAPKAQVAAGPVMPEATPSENTSNADTFGQQ